MFESKPIPRSRLDGAIAALKLVARERRLMEIGSPEHTAAMKEEMRLTQAIFQLVREERGEDPDAP